MLPEYQGHSPKEKMPSYLLKLLLHLPWAPKPTFLEVFMVNNLVFRWPKPLFFMVLGAHGTVASQQESNRLAVSERNLLQHGLRSWQLPSMRCAIDLQHPKRPVNWQTVSNSNGNIIPSLQKAQSFPLNGKMSIANATFASKCPFMTKRSPTPWRHILRSIFSLEASCLVEKKKRMAGIMQVEIKTWVTSLVWSQLLETNLQVSYHPQPINTFKNYMIYKSWLNLNLIRFQQMQIYTKSACPTGTNP